MEESTEVSSFFCTRLQVVVPVLWLASQASSLGYPAERKSKEREIYLPVTWLGFRRAKDASVLYISSRARSTVFSIHIIGVWVFVNDMKICRLEFVSEVGDSEHPDFLNAVSGVLKDKTLSEKVFYLYLMETITRLYSQLLNPELQGDLVCNALQFEP